MHDDELFCHVTCPESCTCHGLAFLCKRTFDVDQHHDLRYLDASGTGMTPGHVTRNLMLVHLSLARCDLTHLHNLTLPNLRSLDLSDNRLHVVGGEELSGVHNLKVLIISGNPISSLFVTDTNSTSSLPDLYLIHLARVKLEQLDLDILSPFPNIHTLNLSDSGVDRVVADDAYRLPRQLEMLDIRGCPMSVFPPDIFLSSSKLLALYADNYKLCCPAMLPAGFNPSNCHAPFDEIASCEDLLRSDVYRVFLSVFAILSVTGNLGTFLFRLFAHRAKSKSSFDVFVAHLCVADFLMGLYLSIIGTADLLYRGTYLWDDVIWRTSAACKMASFLCLLSSEASAFVIVLITLDRFIVLRFPFSSSDRDLHPAAHHKDTIPGHDFSFGVMVVLNFVLFLVIALGQGSIYAAVRANRMSVSVSNRSSQDMSIASRLISIAMSDFLCWFPIGVLGLLASQDVPIPGEFNVAMAIFVLPLNSALNPFLYTLNIILERRRRSREEELLQQLLTRDQHK
nr:hypothetical protein BaRGS_005426 [Batillaria attramentaria]